MKLVSLYSNREAAFAPIGFQDGLNVVMAEIRLPENRDRDSHNLGKTTLGELIDFCLLAQRSPKQFLFRHLDVFEGFTFFLEIEGPSGSFLTIRRSVASPSKISFKRRAAPGAPLVAMPEAEWDHWEMPFERAKMFLDGFLDLTAVSPWNFRKGLGFLLRSQRDYQRVFQLARYVQHADWKPYVAHVLGLDAEAVELIYATEASMDRIEQEERGVAAQLGDSDLTQAKVDGLLLLKNDEIAAKGSILDTFDFRGSDDADTDRVVSDLDVEIARLNQERYGLNYTRRQLQSALRTESIDFDADATEALFREVEVDFAGQLKRNFEELLDFNRAISEERRAYLEQELADVGDLLDPVNSELETLNHRRAEILRSIGGSDSFQRFRRLSDEIVELKAEALVLERQREQLAAIEELRRRSAELGETLRELQQRLRSNLAEASDPKSDGTFTTVRRTFSEIIQRVLDRQALIRVEMNNVDHPEFKAEILDDAGDTTSADEGVTYRKLLCVAFDIAVLSAHLGDRFPRFVFHDGIFEGLDPRKKQRLMDVIESRTSRGIQHIITTLDSDAPAGRISERDIVLTLHDEGDEGRLFKLPSW